MIKDENWFRASNMMWARLVARVNGLGYSFELSQPGRDLFVVIAIPGDVNFYVYDHNFVCQAICRGRAWESESFDFVVINHARSLHIRFQSDFRRAFDEFKQFIGGL